MNIAENLSILWSSGYLNQVFKSANNQSVSMIQDWLGESTLYKFPDNSVLQLSNSEAVELKNCKEFD